MADRRYIAMRTCLFCHMSHEHPLKDEDKWTAIPIGNSDANYWRCPACTAKDRRKPS